MEKIFKEKISKGYCIFCTIVSILVIMFSAMDIQGCKKGSGYFWLD